MIYINQFSIDYHNTKALKFYEIQQSVSPLNAFLFVSEMLFTFSCRWNYRPDHCMYMPVCKSAVEEGVKVLHGCRRAFHIDKWPTFKAIYSAIKSFDFNHDRSSLLKVFAFVFKSFYPLHEF